MIQFGCIKFQRLVIVQVKILQGQSANSIYSQGEKSKLEAFHNKGQDETTW